MVFFFDNHVNYMFLGFFARHIDEMLSDGFCVYCNHVIYIYNVFFVFLNLYNRLMLNIQSIVVFLLFDIRKEHQFIA